jgi:hypothetical protein
MVDCAIDMFLHRPVRHVGAAERAPKGSSQGWTGRRMRASRLRVVVASVRSVRSVRRAGMSDVGQIVALYVC